MSRFDSLYQLCGEASYLSFLISFFHVWYGHNDTGFSHQMILRAKKCNNVLTHSQGKKIIYITIYEHEFVSQKI